MPGLFASLSAGKAWEKLSSFLRAFSSSPPSSSSSSPSASQGDLEELKRLERTMHRIRALLHDAEEHWNIREESAKLRLRELKEVAYDAEDVVEEYEYVVNRRTAEALRQSAGGHSAGKRKRQEVPVPKELVLQARKITERFNEIMDFSDHFTLSETDAERRFIPDISNLWHTSSVIFQPSILGRDHETNNIIDELLSRAGEVVGHPISVKAIVGMGGLGKTTIAQLLYNDQRVRQSFDKQAWVYVSEHFDISTITKKIITSLTNDSSMYTELADLQVKLSDEVKERRVFLVLDDVWNERGNFWDLLCKPLLTARICQIIVTTRSEAVAKLVQTRPFYRPSCLSFDESWSLFRQVAFVGDEQGHDSSTKLVEIGKSIVQKCKGLPLAIKTLGSMLRYEADDKKWKDVLQNELWDLDQPRHEVLPALKLSYLHMPIYLRQCFVSLSLYPKGRDFRENEVIQFWKLLGLLHFHGKDDEYETGRMYLQDLVQRSICQSSYGHSEPNFHLHDLIHDLACFLAEEEEEFYRFDGDTSVAIPQAVRYMFVPEGVTSIENLTLPLSLRVLIVMGGHTKIRNPRALFSNCEKLRALVLKGSNLVAALPHLGNLRLLCHLLLEDTRASPVKIPNSIFGLYNLQTLALDLYCSSYKHALIGIGGLINLHNLPEIHVSGEHGCRCYIGELRNMNNIRDLKIQGLGNLRDVEDGNNVQMLKKKHLKSLYLGFRDVKQQYIPDTVLTSDEQILQSLQPHCNISKLTICNYWSHKYPSWLGGTSFSKLTSIEFLWCESRHLPALGALPSLKYLKVAHMGCMEHLGREFCSHPAGYKGFPSLRELEFKYMSQWSEWSGVDPGDLPCLHTLSITYAKKLRSLPQAPLVSLATLHLHSCHGISTIPAWSALRYLRIQQCCGLRELPTLPSLLTLHMSNCSSLAYVGFDISLTSLELQLCSSINVVSSLPKLTYLALNNCPNLTAVGSLPSLSTLMLSSCPRKDEILHKQLNDHPTLERLDFRDMVLLSSKVSRIHHLDPRTT
ncbi:hypothetical protein ACP4OV_009090 [Aristida adscensionis]